MSARPVDVLGPPGEEAPKGHELQGQNTGLGIWAWGGGGAGHPPSTRPSEDPQKKKKTHDDEI